MTNHSANNIHHIICIVEKLSKNDYALHVDNCYYNRCVMSSPMLLLIMLFCFQRKAHEALLENVPMLKEITVRCLFCCFP